MATRREYKIQMCTVDKFYNALRNLRDIYDYGPPYSIVEMLGITGLFRICFEQSWKAMKELLERDGFPQGQTGSPRQIIKTAYQAGMIEEESVWLSTLIARNNVVHAYNKDIALDIIKETKEKFYPMFKMLKKKMEEQWT